MVVWGEGEDRGEWGCLGLDARCSWTLTSSLLLPFLTAASKASAFFSLARAACRIMSRTLSPMVLCSVWGCGGGVGGEW